jgi:anhydro-N-acetylmuramic acid kinase
MTHRWYIGLSSGSSLNGVDAALVRIEGAGATLVPNLEHFLHDPYGRDVRELLMRGATALGPRYMGVAHRVLGEAFAAAARKLVEHAKKTWRDILAAGVAGHTAWHDTEGRYPSTLSLGMPAVVAERTGLTMVSDFRSRDLLAGGQGFPLTCATDARLFSDPAERRALIHLGGVATVLWIPPAASPRDVVGFQAAPCTLMLDGLMRLVTSGKETFDPGGKYAVQGRCLEPLVQRWLSHPVFKRKPPRIIPCHEFDGEFLTQAAALAKQHDGNLHDLLCSATHFAARAIVQAVHSFLPATPDRFLVSGGGVRNGLLWRLLEQQLTPVPMERIDRHGVPIDAREAVAFAALAALTMDAVPANVSAATGAAGPRLLGTFTPGADANWARCLAWMAGQTAHLRLAA